MERLMEIISQRHDAACPLQRIYLDSELGRKPRVSDFSHRVTILLLGPQS
jgi:hypothetical protein